MISALAGSEMIELFCRLVEAQEVQMARGLTRRTLVSGDAMMICRFDLESGVQIPEHSHPHDQAGYVVSGRVIITVNGNTLELGPGDSYCAPSGVLHSARALEASVVVDTFSPPRDDYLSP